MAQVFSPNHPALRAAAAYRAAAQAPPGSMAAKARTAAQGFEAALLTTLVDGMLQGLGEEGPLGKGGAGGGAWRGFLVDDLAGGLARAGGLGLAPQVFREMLRHQEARRG